jgi:phage-related baseplate assembly protein
MSTIPTFIQRDPAVVLSEIKAQLEAKLGREIMPAQVEHLIMQVVAYREVLINERFNAGAAQLLYQYSVAPMLDYIAALVSVERLPPAAAGCKVLFYLVPGHVAVVIPGGTRVATSDGKIVFWLTDNISVPVGTNEVEALVTAQVPGADANGYPVGSVTRILDPLAFLQSVTNTTPTAGGSDDESDESLRERIKLAPSQFSTAGSRQSYLFHAKRANASIIDVSVSSPVPGTVMIVPLITGYDYTQVLLDVYNTCSAETVRPLCDTVIVAPPVTKNYAIEVELVAFHTADLTMVQNTVTANLQAYAAEKANRLGLDIVRSHISQLCRIPEVYDVEVIQPATNIEVDFDEVPVNTSIVVTITDVSNG